MTNGSAGTTTTLITLVVAALVVVRFLFRELRERKVRLRSIWIRPGILGAFTVVLIVVAFTVPRTNMAFLALACVVGAALGVVTGMLVARSTTFRPADERGAVLAKGNTTTVIVWIAALALRYVARFAFAGSGASPAEQVELNAGLLALVTAAFVVVALEFHRAIDRLAPAQTQTQSQTRSL
jgi:steroid 5-alpha reductase family enzyme